jgi:hypothetical protein
MGIRHPKYAPIIGTIGTPFSYHSGGSPGIARLLPSSRINDRAGVVMSEYRIM